MDKNSNTIQLFEYQILSWFDLSKKDSQVAVYFLGSRGVRRLGLNEKDGLSLSMMSTRLEDIANRVRQIWRRRCDFSEKLTPQEKKRFSKNIDFFEKKIQKHNIYVRQICSPKGIKDRFRQASHWVQAKLRGVSQKPIRPIEKIRSYKSTLPIELWEIISKKLPPEYAFTRRMHKVWGGMSWWDPVACALGSLGGDLGIYSEKETNDFLERNRGSIKHLRDLSLTSGVIRKIATMTCLQSLRLRYRSLKSNDPKKAFESDIRAFSQLKKLRYLRIPTYECQKFTGDLTPLSQLKNLTTLVFPLNFQVTKETLKQLAKCKSLEEIEFDHCKFSDDINFLLLKPLEKLERLMLGKTPYSEKMGLPLVALYQVNDVCIYWKNWPEAMKQHFKGDDFEFFKHY